jgi:hypothetical protein
LNYWKELWTRCEPVAVVVSSLQDAESQLPALAANKVGIPTYSIPHGAGPVRAEKLVVAERVLHSDNLTRRVMRRSGVPDDRLVASKNLIADSEYPELNTAANQSTSHFSVLALTGPIGIPNCLATDNRVSAQSEALNVLGNPPSKLCRPVRVLIKPHPGWPDSELLRCLGSNIMELVAPSSADLGQLLSDADVVIAVNYVGGALVHAAKSHKPIILLWNDPLIGKVGSYEFADLYGDVGMKVHDCDELWPLVQRLISDQSFLTRLSSRAAEFSRSNFDDSDYPTINDVLNQPVADATAI